ncbi:hypothetical protein M2272_004044 [Mycobacterium frederiksbergense]|uniref:DUF4097 domain-containing protein n=1 Tax=Mycolicibacterium frederiksbergense TaxID=117567 RepID=A0ABT6L359_9MYCO|nr:DUF4097 family beta strand repeat-containing protein [Mycolicibacterium frederiksbergense]MDH6197391.1 hypothetical protein [Mycolicibacterium frederiksbergense]
MSTFNTPEPISVTVEVVAGTVHLTASDRDDTVVEVAPRDPGRASDVRVAEQTRVDYRDGTLTVTAGRRMLSLGRGGAVRIDIALPAESRLKISSASADTEADGRYSDCRFATASGDVRIDDVAGNIKADSASGDIAVGKVVGEARIATASGDARIDHVEGNVKFQAASGNLIVGTLRGNLTVQAASGSVTVAVAAAGALTAHTSSGEVEVGIPEGTAARLELNTRSGAVDNRLGESDGPVAGDETVIVQARTGSGDISIRRATTAAAG